MIIDDGTDFDRVQKDKEIGNYFETVEEAEQAVEKLKAWKRLRDKEFRFIGWSIPADGHARVMIEGTCAPDSVDELNILFSEEG